MHSVRSASFWFHHQCQTPCLRSITHCASAWSWQAYRTVRSDRMLAHVFLPSSTAHTSDATLFMRSSKCERPESTHQRFLETRGSHSQKGTKPCETLERCSMYRSSLAFFVCSRDGYSRASLCLFHETSVVGHVGDTRGTHMTHSGNSARWELRRVFDPCFGAADLRARL